METGAISIWRTSTFSSLKMWNLLASVTLHIQPGGLCPSFLSTQAFPGKLPQKPSVSQMPCLWVIQGSSIYMGHTLDLILPTEMLTLWWGPFYLLLYNNSSISHILSVLAQPIFSASTMYHAWEIHYKKKKKRKRKMGKNKKLSPLPRNLKFSWGEDM